MGLTLGVLLVEDTPADAELVLRVLRQAGYGPTWERVDTEAEYLQALERSHDVIISDYSMPQFSAPRALELLQQRGLDIPFIVVSGTIGEETAVDCIKRGATDYLLKDRLTRLGEVTRIALEDRRRRALLTAAEARYRDIFEHAIEGMYEATADGVPVAVNPALARMLGYDSPSELIHSVRDVVSQLHVDCESASSFWRLLKEEGAVSDFEVQVRRRDGSLIWISEHARLVDDVHRGQKVVGSWSDVTQRKHAEQLLMTQYAVSSALAESESLDLALTKVIQTICGAFTWDLGAMWTVDEKSNVLRCVAFWHRSEVEAASFEAETRQRTFGRGVGLPGRVWESGQPCWIVNLELDDNFPRTDYAASAGLHGAFCQPIFFKNDITDIIEFFSREARPPVAHFLQVSETVGGMLGMYLRRRRAEQAQEESDRRFRQLAENINEVFWLCDADTNEMFYISPAYERIWGRTCQSLYDAPRSFLDSIHPEDRAHMFAIVESLAQSGRFEQEYRILRPDGTLRWIRARSFPIRNEQGLLYRIAGIAEDITEGKDLERKFLQAQKMEAVGQLAGGVAHDFNNVLTAVIGYGELVQNSFAPSDPRREYMQEALTAADRAAGLTRQLLAFSRQQILEPRVLDPNDVIGGVKSMLAPLIGEDIELRFVLAPDVGHVRADPGQLEQVIMNLAVNARDAMPNGGKLTIETQSVMLTEGELHGRHLVLAISDTGTGMSEEVKAHAFEPFFTTKENGKGTGLGLATCFGIIKQSAGNIAIYSEPGVGTTFKIYLPCVDEIVEPIVLPQYRVTPRGTETVLLVEDEAAVRKLSALILRNLGYTVLEASNGAEALALAEEHGGSIALAVTDLIMPQMGGKELSIRLGRTHLETRFVFCSGYTDDAIIVHHGVLDPGIAFLQKPYSPHALAVKVREVLDSAR